jgi:PadR family transcriptional regulator
VPKENRKDLFPGALEMMVLRTLQRAPLHGYALAQQIKRSSKDLLQIEEGSLYPALQRMLKDGWLKAHWDVSPTGRRIRVYQVTAAGAKHLDREVSSFERMLEGIRFVLDPEEA